MIVQFLNDCLVFIIKKTKRRDSTSLFKTANCIKRRGAHFMVLNGLIIGCQCQEGFYDAGNTWTVYLGQS